MLFRKDLLVLKKMVKGHKIILILSLFAWLQCSNNRNVTFLLTILQWKKRNVLQFLCVCVFSLRYPACNAHALHYVYICSLSCLYIIFTSSYKGQVLGKKCLNFFLTSFYILSEPFLILRRIQRVIIGVNTFSRKVLLTLPIF